ncbi:bidirectional hydrogenase complex protein HoxE [Anaeromyxobacter oryzae]|uniref:Hydrogenase HoxE n=1 Tax=Anaeromyxobacter oryzae TaxID=2918170 RepID=A0ABM7X1W3_9BACT|nr:bidirectional hydrogenase complex protein HoxE [Anaeromyxobacter oryzae]BDG05772.1 hydrogenase HoxE [Anaeromyxobacter oryzae]
MAPSPAPAAASGGDKRLELLDAAMRRQQFQPDALLEVLRTAQELYGFLSRETLRHVGRSLRLPLSRVYGVATFYDHFTLRPSGEHTCTVCLGTACYVKGAGGIVAALRRDLGVGPGSTTPDGKVSFEVVRCVGACGIAPAVVYDHRMARAQAPAAVLERVRRWRR